MDFTNELSKYGYNSNNSIPVETLIKEILPNLFNKAKVDFQLLNREIYNELTVFCEKEFSADFENDYIIGKGSKAGMSDRTEIFSKHISNKIIEICKENR